MPCHKPLTAWIVRNPGGNARILFKPTIPGCEPISLPCGRCIGCRLERARQWAVRCVKEAQLHEKNCFLTLTYSDENLPENRSLRKSDLQKFFKRFRKFLVDRKILYFACGEYGDATARPHYHALIFGFEFEDKKRIVVKNERGFSVHSESPTLRRLWPLGLSSCDGFSFESAAYVARYNLKKVNGEMAEEYYQGRQPEFLVMSRRPAIAQRWYEKYGQEVRNLDSVVSRGIECKPPRFFDKLTKKFFPAVFESIQERRLTALNNLFGGDMSRLEAALTRNCAAQQRKFEKRRLQKL